MAGVQVMESRFMSAEPDRFTATEAYSRQAGQIKQQSSGGQGEGKRQQQPVSESFRYCVGCERAVL